VRVVVDTSVLITALRSTRNPPSSSVVVLQELLGGTSIVPVLDSGGLIEAE
jgi:hypothetical protein